MLKIFVKLVLTSFYNCLFDYNLANMHMDILFAYVFVLGVTTTESIIIFIIIYWILIKGQPCVEHIIYIVSFNPLDTPVEDEQ